MTFDERARKIIEMLGERGYWAYHEKSVIDEHIVKIADQLREVEREALAHCCLCEEGEEICICKSRGFHVAREKAAGIADEKCCPFPCDCSRFAECIRRMEP